MWLNTLLWANNAIWDYQKRKIKHYKITDKWGFDTDKDGFNSLYFAFILSTESKRDGEGSTEWYMSFPSCKHTRMSEINVLAVNLAMTICTF